MKQIFVLLMLVTLVWGCPNSDYVDLGPVLAPTPTPIPGLPQPPAGSTVVDNFDSDTQYNGSFTNDLGGYTDDDSGTTVFCSVSLGKLSIVFPADAGYWYSTFSASAGCYDASAFTKIEIAYKGHAGGETFRIVMPDFNTCPNTGKVNNPRAALVTATTSWQTLSMPFGDFPGLNPSQSLSFVIDTMVGTGVDLAYIALVP